MSRRPIDAPDRGTKRHPLAPFAPATRAWFEGAFDAATPAQAQGWPSIARGEHTLICAPTGSGKTLAAFLWSVYALFWGTAGTPGMTDHFRMTTGHGGGAGNIYLEAAAGVTTFILAGRYFEARAKRRAGAALRALLELGAKEVSVLRDGTEHRVLVSSEPIEDPSGRPLGAACVFEDVTERRRAEQRLADALREQTTHAREKARLSEALAARTSITSLNLG